MKIMHQQRVEVILPARGQARVAIVSDSHSYLHEEGLQHLKTYRPHAILHAGDIGDLGVLDILAEIAPLYAVRGNIDARDFGTGGPMPDWLDLTFKRGQTPILRAVMTHIAVYGPRLLKRIRERAHAAQAALVFCGHSHVPLLVKDGPFVVFNPGSMGPRRTGLPIVYGEMTIEERVHLQHRNCEGGEIWLPHPTPYP